ncbi:DUF3800 domain-containing protein [Donghicola sp. XS_ASV15]|uniref:DUF3800 domain-containing protein n=1 Tax=Donghicola sp. XS_ASV15 TaxID=3241295 RepID=UPI003511F330
MNNYKYVLYIDEAGDDGLSKVKPLDENGATEWLVISGYLVRSKHEHSIQFWLDDISKEINSQSRVIHFRKLSPTKGKRAAELLAKKSARAFVVASNKKNMRGYRNVRAEQAGGKQWFYNWLVRILLERVTEFCSLDCGGSPDENSKIKIVFSKRGGHSYGQTKAYLEWLKIQSNPVLNKRRVDFRFLKFPLIDYVPHYLEAGLQCSDIVASAFYRSINIDGKSQNIEAAQNLRRILARGETKEIKDSGLVLLPSDPRVLSLTEEQASIFQYYGFSKRETAQDRGRFDQKR